jgi:hypothetical protein
VIAMGSLSTPALAVLFAAEAARGGPSLSPTVRTSMVMALVGIALLGLLFVAVILLGGHWVRRQGKHRRGRAVPPDRPTVVPAKPAKLDDTSFDN